MRLSAVLMSSLSAVLLLSACDATYDHPPIRSGAWIPTAYANQHEPVYADEQYEYETVEISGNQVGEIPQAAPETTALDTTTYSQSTVTTTTTAPVAAGYGDLVNETYFAHGSARLSPSDKKAIRAVAKNAGDAQLTVVGHASQRVDGNLDPSRKEDVNYNMAQKRAVAVSSELGKAGVEPSRITAVSKGDTDPNDYPGDKTQETADRRVEIFSAR